MKNTTELQEDWSEMKGKLKQKLTQITDSSALFIEGKQDEMPNGPQTKLSKSKAEIQQIISKL